MSPVARVVFDGKISATIWAYAARGDCVGGTSRPSRKFAVKIFNNLLAAVATLFCAVVHITQHP